jgi:hypothetical protein
MPAEAADAAGIAPRPSAVQTLLSRLARAPADELSFAENAMLAELLGKLGRLPVRNPYTMVLVEEVAGFRLGS